MDIGEYIGLNYYKQYTTDELNNKFSKFNNLDMKNFYIKYNLITFLREQDASSIIKFVDMFKDINEFEDIYCGYSLAGNIISVIISKHYSHKIHVYKIMDHMLKMNMNIKAIYNDNVMKYGIKIMWHKRCQNDNHDIVHYMTDNYNVIQNVRKITNNYDVLLFDITDDLPLIKTILLITKCKEKILPKFIITHKILYYYLLAKNEIYND